MQAPSSPSSSACAPWTTVPPSSAWPLHWQCKPSVVPRPLSHSNHTLLPAYGHPMSSYRGKHWLTASARYVFKANRRPHASCSNHSDRLTGRVRGFHLAHLRQLWVAMKILTMASVTMTVAMGVYSKSTGCSMEKSCMKQVRVSGCTVPGLRRGCCGPRRPLLHAVEMVDVRTTGV